MGRSGRSQLWPAKRCGTVSFGKLAVFCFSAGAVAHRIDSTSDRNLCDSRERRRLHAGSILELSISCGILGYGKNADIRPFESSSCLFPISILNKFFRSNNSALALRGGTQKTATIIGVLKITDDRSACLTHVCIAIPLRMVDERAHRL